MRIACIGGGPAGLYFALLMKRFEPAHEITVWERNARDDTFGFGVVFSDETLQGIRTADAEFYDEMHDACVHWDDIRIHHRGTVTTSGGHGFAAMSRHRLLDLLQRRCLEWGVDLRFRQQAPPVGDLRDYDLVVAADGVNSAVRTELTSELHPRLEVGRCRYMWLATDVALPAFEFHILESPYGVFQLHGYPYSAGESTVIVETTESVWHDAGFAELADDVGPGESDDASVTRCAELFAGVLKGHTLRTNRSRWTTFPTVGTRHWHHDNIVLLGDAAHTAHFSIGSGTKLALEDAYALAASLAGQHDVPSALAGYEVERQPVVQSIQRAARASQEWFETLDQYVGQHPAQFAFNLLTRSRRVTYDNLRIRDAGFVDRVDDWFADSEIARGVVPSGSPPCPPMFQPFRLRGITVRNRVVVSPMDMYSAEDGLIGDFHLVHLGSRALGGAGLVMTEMVCVSPEGRITPGCAGLYAPAHEDAYRRLVDFVHRHTDAKIGIQLGHSGRKGSTRLMWDGIDEPLPVGNWPLLAPSPLPYLAAGPVPREMSADDMRTVLHQFVQSALAAERAGFDLLELHCGHGYLLSSFLTPLGNHRKDSYGGSLDNRLRYPLEVFDAVRDAWPRNKPVTVRISATDWAQGGLEAEDSVEIAAAFAAHGADAIDVSTGQTTPEAQPAYGRSYQTPFADRIRNVVGIPTIAVGAISSHDDVNSIILAGRADLCALGRPHLYDPAWTLHAAADQDFRDDDGWPVQYRAGSRKPPAGRTNEPRSRLGGLLDSAALKSPALNSPAPTGEPRCPPPRPAPRRPTVR